MRDRNLPIIIMILGLAIQEVGPIVYASNSCELTYDSVLNRSYYTTADKIPIFKGGPKEMMKTINRNLKWPGGRCDIVGTVFVACIIEANGQLTNKRILKSLSTDKDCNADEEALKVMDFLTSWVPGQCDGKNVAVQYIIPVKFKLTNE